MVSQDFLKCTTSMVPVNVCTILAFKWLLYKSTKIALVRFLSTYIHKMYIGMAFQYFHNCLTWWLQSMNAQYLHLNGLSIFPLKLHQYGFSWCIPTKFPSELLLYISTIAPPPWFLSMYAQYLHLNGLFICPLKLHLYGFSQHISTKCTLEWLLHIS